MIPALLAIPAVEGAVGQVVNALTPSASSAPGSTFNPYLNRATTAASQASATTSRTGTMRAEQWNQMGNSDVQSWMKSLAGCHVNATDESGRTFSGVVGGVQQVGNTLALNIGGHLVSLSQLKQVSWSPSTV
jgi:hypothetical protein